MKNNTTKNSSTLVEKLINLFRNYPNTKKKGSVSEMLLKEDCHNKNQTEEDYQNEQKEWLKKVGEKKPADFK